MLPRMIGRLNHLAIVVADLATETARYRDLLGAIVMPSAGVAGTRRYRRLCRAANTKVELLAPMGEGSPVAAFLAKTGGGMHHVCYEVEDLVATRDRLLASGVRVQGDGEPKIGAHGKPVLFLHPKDFSGTLIELEQG